MSAKILSMLALSTFVPFVCRAQCSANGADACKQVVPHFMKFNGRLKNVADVPQGVVVAVRFVIYGDSTGGTPLWMEVQNTELDSQGHYEVMLGTASAGIPMELFTSGEPRWLAVQPLLPGAAEQARVLLVSVPYALEAADAQTLGGLPASAFARAVPAPASQSVLVPQVNAPAVSLQAEAALGGVPSPLPSGRNLTFPGVTATTVPRFSASQSLENSQITDSNGVVSMKDLSNILFADQFSGGVPDAVNACPANGCIIYATAPNVNLNLGTIDAGAKVITLYLGPYTYTVKQIKLQKGLKIIGMGASGGNRPPGCTVAVPCNGTTLQSINGNNPVFVLPQTSNSPATNVWLTGFRLIGSPGNTNEDGFFLDTSTTLNSGLWYSTLDDVYLEGFAGIGIHLKGRNNDFGSICQWVLFNNVVVWRTSGGGNALRLEGSAFELRFRNCEFDGPALGDGTNIYLGGLAGGISGYPLSIAFEGLVTQQAATAVQIDGGVHITFYGSHHEQLWAAYQINDSFGIWTEALTITDSYFAGNVGNNGGSGYLLNVATTVAKGISFTHNSILGAPDSVVKGTNLSSVAYQDNLYQPVAYSAPNAAPVNVAPTSGITMGLNPATTINIQGAHSVALNPSSTPIATIQSTLGPGEMVTFFTVAGPVTFSSSGNIDLMETASVNVNGSITFIRSDLGGSQWIPVAQWSPQSSPAQTVFVKPCRPSRPFEPRVGDDPSVRPLWLRP
jgi:hypothetical protein